MREYGQFIDNASRDANGGERIDRISPAVGSTVARFAAGGAKDIDQRVKEQRLTDWLLNESRICRVTRGLNR